MSELSLSVTLNAKPSEVFSAFALPDKLIQWFAPGDAVVAQVMSSFLVGGKYNLVLQEPNGQQFQLMGEYIAIEKDRHIRYSWAWGDTQEESLITEVDVVLVGLDDNTTQMTLTHSGFANDEERDQHQHGWIACLEKLSMLSLSASA